ncbi:hypothetical protein ACFYUR_18820 [Micromonospora haikouensis]|uniref:hypothetical protein n=1 Tax=Micromonospora haikouensis TaxID=686309 RepID=UPI0036919F57
MITYRVALLVLLIVGLVSALAFLSWHRPRRWRRLAAWDASGWVLLAALLYVRQIVLLVLRWPTTSHVDTVDAVFGLGSLAVIDALLILRVLSYKRFVEQDRAARVRR